MRPMNRRLAQRIHGEHAARTFWQSGGEGLNIPALDEIIERKEAVMVWTAKRTRILNRVLLFIAGAVFVVPFFFRFNPEWFIGGIIYGFLIWAFGWLVIASRYPVGDDPDLKFARRLREELEQEADAVDRLRARAERKEAFALYLRTFKSETDAMTELEMMRSRQALLDAAAQDQADGLRGMALGKEESASRLKADWKLKRQVLATIGAEIPIVCLGNINLQHDKRADFTELKVDYATVVSADWWTLFQEMEASARFSFVVVDELTTEIGRELAHLMQKGKPFLVICSAFAHDRLKFVREYQNLIEHRSVRHIILAEDNLAPLQSAVAALV